MPLGRTVIQSGRLVMSTPRILAQRHGIAVVPAEEAIVTITTLT